jgi:ribonuclease HII
MDYVIGCDEAGRGCVIGALVMAAFAVPRDSEHKLRLAGARDSKELTAEKRKALQKTLSSMGKFRTRHISAVEINEAMRRRKSLNELEAQALAELLDSFVPELEGIGAQVSAIYVDSPDPVPQTYERRIRRHAKNLSKVRIVSDNKSEGKYPCVAASSIFAKTERDAELEKIKEFLGEDFGNGYTHDKTTVDFVRRRRRDEKLAPFLRVRWKTVKNMETVQVDLNKFI